MIRRGAENIPLLPIAAAVSSGQIFPVHLLRLFGLRLTALALLFLGSPLLAQTMHLTTPELDLAFVPTNGAFTGLSDRANGHNFIGTNQPASSLWRLELVSPQGNLVLTPTNAGSFALSSVMAAQAETALEWKEFNLPEAPRLLVRVTTKMPRGTSQSLWHISVENLGSLRLREVAFPRLPDLAPQPDESLAVPNWAGQLATDARAFLSRSNQAHRVESHYPGHTSMQCLAFYREQGPGLLLSCNDTNSFLKNFVFWGDGQGNVGCEVIHLPERPVTGGPALSYSLPYDVVLGTFTGDWFTAAAQYRRWATNQWWAKESRLVRNSAPAWAAQTALWVWNRGRSENVLRPAIALQEKLGLPVSVFWHWWHGCAYDTGFPEYLPPREGTAPFQTALQSAHAHDIRAIVYMNQRLWGMTTASWTNRSAATYAVKGADGSIRPEVYNTFTKQACASMCMHTDFWRDTYSALAGEAIRELGVDGIYMDQACSSLACYDASHGHSLGGGTYWVNGFRQLATSIRQNASANPPVLGGEGVGEAWLPYLDLMLCLQVSRDRYSAPDGWEPIPFFHAVYHPYTIFYGNYSSLTMPPYDDLWPAATAPKEPLALLDKKFSRQFLLEQARAFTWGQQPTVANFLPEHLRSRAEEIAFALQLAKLRAQSLPYLLHGTMLPPLALKAPTVTADISRLSIYAGQKGGLTAFTKEIPLALSSVWQAPDGKTAVALVNLDEKIQALTLRLDAATYHLPKKGKIYRQDGSSRKYLDAFRNGSAQIQVKIPARSGAVIEFVTE